MKNPPAFQFYPADYLADMNVRLLSWASKGLYMDLLCYCWREGYIPADSSAIAMLCGCHDLAIVEPCLKLFSTHPDDPSKLVHLRLIAEREKQIAFSNSKSEAGKLGAQVKWNKRKSTKGGKVMAKDSNATISPLAKNSSTSSTSSSSSKELSKDNSNGGKSDLLRRAEKLFNRRESTQLDKSESKAYKDALPMIRDTTEEEWQMLERFYAAKDTYKRTSFATLLNNWNGEVQKAKDHHENGGKPRPIGNFGVRQPSTHATRSGYAEQEELEIPDL